MCVLECYLSNYRQIIFPKGKPSIFSLTHTMGPVSDAQKHSHTSAWFHRSILLNATTCMVSGLALFGFYTFIWRFLSGFDSVHH